MNSKNNGRLNLAASNTHLFLNFYNLDKFTGYLFCGFLKYATII